MNDLEHLKSVLDHLKYRKKRRFHDFPVMTVNALAFVSTAPPGRKLHSTGVVYRASADHERAAKGFLHPALKRIINLSLSTHFHEKDAKPTLSFASNQMPPVGSMLDPTGGVLA